MTMEEVSVREEKGLSKLVIPQVNWIPSSGCSLTGSQMEGCESPFQELTCAFSVSLAFSCYSHPIWKAACNKDEFTTHKVVFMYCICPVIPHARFPVRCLQGSGNIFLLVSLLSFIIIFFPFFQACPWLHGFWSDLGKCQLSPRCQISVSRR